MERLKSAQREGPRPPTPRARIPKKAQGVPPIQPVPLVGRPVRPVSQEMGRGKPGKRPIIPRPTGSTPSPSQGSKELLLLLLIIFIFLFFVSSATTEDRSRRGRRWVGANCGRNRPGRGCRGRSPPWCVRRAYCCKRRGGSRGRDVSGGRVRGRRRRASASPEEAEALARSPLYLFLYLHFRWNRTAIGRGYFEACKKQVILFVLVREIFPKNSLGSLPTTKLYIYLFYVTNLRVRVILIYFLGIFLGPKIAFSA